MRGRSIRLSILILFLLALSAAALAFPSINIDLPGFPALVRGGDGPLGLRLGLDLSGGGQLVYEADTGSRVEIAFTEPADAVILYEVLDSFGVADYTVTPRDDRSYLITAGLLDDPVKEGLQDAIAAALQDSADGAQLPAANAAIVRFQFPEIALTEPADAATLEDALAALASDIDNYTIISREDNSYLVTVSLREYPVKEGLPADLAAALQAAAAGAQLPAANAATLRFQWQRPDLVTVVVEAVTPLELENRTVAVWNVAEDDVNVVRISTDNPLDDDLQERLREALNAAVAAEDAEVTDISVVENTPVGAIASYELNETLTPTADQMDGVLDTITRRVNLFGTEEPIIQLFGDDRIIVQLPGASGSITTVSFIEPTQPAAVEGVVQGQGFEDFTVALTDDFNRDYEIRTVSLNANRQQELRTALGSIGGGVDRFATTGGIEAAKALIGQTAQLVFKERTCADLTCATFTDAEIGLTGDDLDNAYSGTDPNTGEWEVNIAFNERGAGIFGDLTQRIVGIDTKRIAVFLDDELLIAPVALAWIRDGRSSITGNFTREEASTLAIQLESGRLPVPLRLIQQSDVDALLGSASLERSLMAGIIGLGLVLLFMVAYYRAAGIVAALALMFYTVIVLAVFKLVPVTLGLSGIGAFILSIGLAVDANILIFERMKEEIRIGRTLSSSMEVGFNRAWPAIRDGNFSTLITCLVLLWLGSRTADDLVTGFAFTLFIGVVASMFTAIIVSRNLLQLSAWLGLGRKIALFTPERPPRPADGAATAAAGPGRARRAEGR